MPSLSRISAKVVKNHPYAWLWESLESDPGFLLQSMFGGKALYLDGKLMLFFAAKKKENWHGVLVCSKKICHADLINDFSSLVPHPILPKWLYLPDQEEMFEKLATQLVALAAKRDPRIGVLPHPKKKDLSLQFTKSPQHEMDH